MIEKNWYIFLKNHHTGPLAKDEVSQLLKKGHLNKKTYIWKRGQKDWLTLSEVDEFKDFFEQISLPPIPVAEEYEHLETAEAQPLEEDHAAANESCEEIELSEWDEETEIMARRPIWPILAMLFLVTLIASAGTFYYLHVPVIERPLGMDAGLFQKALKIIQTPLEKGARLEIFYSSDAKKIWVASNHPGEGKVELKIKSLPYRTIGNIKLTMNREAYLKNHFASFGAIVDKSYRPLPEGLYQFDLFSPGLVRVWEKWLASFVAIPALPQANQGEVLLSNQDLVQVKKQVNAFNQKIVERKLKNQSDLLQKYNSFTAMLESLETLFQRVHENLKRGKDFQEFQRRYTQELAPLLSEISYENSKLIEKLKEKKLDDLANKHQEQLTLGKKMATLVMNTIDQHNKLKKINSQKKTALADSFFAQTQKIKEKIFWHIHALQAEIEKHNQELAWK